jgi:alkyl hydroperoxide reductase subunit AhpC
MNAIRQFIEVKNNSFSVILPKDFTAKNVEVIIMPTEDDFSIPEWHKEIVLERIKNPQTPVDAFKMIDELEKESIENL